MKRLNSVLLSVALWCILPLSAHAQSIELMAISDFTNLNSGEVPYYLDIAGDRNALAINAADEAQRNKFARAEHEFKGAEGLYDITINALGEIDGDGTYRLLVNGVVQGVSVNTPVSDDYTVIEHTFQAIALIARDVIAVESNAVSNNTIPEGDGFAFARGRWRSVTLTPQDNSTSIADHSVDLGLTLSTVESLAQDGGQAPFIVSVINHSPTNTSTTPIATFVLPDEIAFSTSDGCISTQSGVSCVLSNLAPGEIANASFTGDINGQGWMSLSASISSDQADNNRSNNTASLSFESGPAAIVVTDSTTSETNEPVTPPTNSAEPMSNAASKSGSTGMLGLMTLLLFGLYRSTSRRR